MSLDLVMISSGLLEFTDVNLLIEAQNIAPRSQSGEFFTSVGLHNHCLITDEYGDPIMMSR